MANTISRVISDETLSRIIHIESGGKPNAKAPTSSAGGLGQFLTGTWLAVVNKHKPAWSIGLTSAELLPLRFDPKCAIEMLARFTEDNARFLGAGYTGGDLYLAHFAGAGTAKRLLRAAPELSASNIFSPAAIAANRSILQGKNCGDVRSWANRKMAAAGGRDWIAVHWLGKPPVTPAKTKAATGAVVAGGAGTVATAAQQGWGVGAWIAIIAAVAIVSVGGFLVWRRRKHRDTATKVEGEVI